jgi:hypothetical protein
MRDAPLIVGVDVPMILRFENVVVRTFAECERIAFVVHVARVTVDLVGEHYSGSDSTRERMQRSRRSSAGVHR